MSKQIDLGTFQWDTNKLEHQIAANTLKMGEFSKAIKFSKDQLKEQSKTIAELENKIESEQKAQERLNTQLSKGYISQEKYNSEIDKSNKKLDELVNEQINLGKAQANNIIAINSNEQATKALRLENNELNKYLSAGRTELSQNEGAYRDLNQELNALKTEAKNLGAQMIILEQDGKGNSEEYKQLAAQFGATSTKANELNDKFKAVDAAVGDNNRTVGDYRDQIKNAFSDLNIFSGGLSGFIARSQEAGGAGNLLKNSFNEIKTGVVGATKAALGFIATPLGAVIAAIAIVVGVLYSVFKNFTPIIDKVEQGFAAISAVGNVLINSVIGLVTGTKSLSETFSGLGSSMRNAAVEAARLKKAQQDLEDAMEGQVIQNAKIQGQIDALIIKSKDRTKSEGQRLEALKQAGDLEKENYKQNLRNATEELRIAETTIRQKAGITRAEEVELRKRYKNDSDFYNKFKELAEARGQNQDDEFKNFQNALTKYYDVYGQHNKFTEKTVNANNKIIEKGEEDRQRAFDKAEAEAEKRRKKIESDREKARQKAEEEAKREIDIAREVANIRIESAKTELAEYISMNADKFADDKRSAASKLALQLQYLDEVKKQQAEINALEQKAKTDAVNLKIQEIDEKVKAGKKLTENDIAEKKLLNDQLGAIVKEYQQKDLELEKETLKKKKDATSDNENEILQQKKLSQAISFQQKILALQKEGGAEFEIQRLQEQQRFQQELSDWATENKIKMDLNNDQYFQEEEIKTERRLLQDQIATEADAEEIRKKQNQLNVLDLMVAQSAENQRRINKMKEEQKFSDISNTLGQAAGLFAEHTAAYKALSVAQATINTFLGVSKVLAEYPGPIGWAMSAVQVAVGIANVAKIASVQTPKGYATSGLISGGVEISRSNGDNRLITAKDGEVILNEKHQEMLGGPSIFGMIGVPGFATSGVVGTPASNLATVQNSLSIKSPQIVLDETAIAQIAGAIYSGSQSGISDLSDNRKIANGANF